MAKPLVIHARSDDPLTSIGPELVQTLAILKARGVLPGGTEVWCKRTASSSGMFALLDQFCWVELLNIENHAADTSGCIMITEDEIRWGQTIPGARSKQAKRVLNREPRELQCIPILLAVHHTGKTPLTVVTNHYGKPAEDGDKEVADTHRFVDGICRVNNLITVVDVTQRTTVMSFSEPSRWSRSKAHALGSEFLVNGLGVSPEDYIVPENPEDWNVLPDDDLLAAGAEVLGIFDLSARDTGEHLARRILHRHRPLWHDLPHKETYSQIESVKKLQAYEVSMNRSGCTAEAVLECYAVWQDCVFDAGVAEAEARPLPLTEFTGIESDADARAVAARLGLPEEAVVEVHHRLRGYAQKRLAQPGLIYFGQPGWEHLLEAS